jgi:hypothetical protein
MTQLVAAKSRTVARTETVVAYRGSVVNPDWPGLAVTVAANDSNGGPSAFVGAPTYLSTDFNTVSGGANSFTARAETVTGFVTYRPSFFVGQRARIFRLVNGELQLIRDDTVATANVDQWLPHNAQPVTQTTYEFQFADYTERSGTYTIGVAEFGADGRIGPVTTTTVTVAGPTYTVLTLPTISTTGSNRSVSGRNPALATITGLTAQVQAGSTHNVQLSWNAAGSGQYVILINYDGISDRLASEAGTITLSGSGAAVLANDMVILDSAPVLDESTNRASRRVVGIVANRRITNPAGAEPIVNCTFDYVPFGGGLPKPDITYPEHYLEIIPNSGVAAGVSNPYHSGTDQSFYEVLVPGRTYRIELIAAAASATNATLRVDDSNLNTTIALTTSWQTFAFDFTVATMRKNTSIRSWVLTAATTNINLRIASVRVFDTAFPYGQIRPALPSGVDVRDHTLIKTFPITLDSMTSRPGSTNAFGWTLATLFQNCLDSGSYPHLQIEWIYDDDYYYDLITFLCAPASSGEPLALKREALGFGPIHTTFARWSYEDGNERWNSIMRQMFATATDSVTAATYTGGQLSAMFAKRRRAIMESNPYWPTSNPPVEFTGGWLRSTSYTVQAADFAEADYASVALYTGGWDVNQVVIDDVGEAWNGILTCGDGFHRADMQPIVTALEGSGLKLAVYEAGPGYQLNGLNGVVLSVADAVKQEAIMKSVGSCTAMINSTAVAATLGFGPYNYFTWGEGPYWQAGRPASEGGGLYRPAAFLQGMHSLLGRCMVFETSTFIGRTRPVPILDNVGVQISTQFLPRANVYQFESLDHPGRVGILYVNTDLNYDVLEPSDDLYEEGNTGAASFRYHTGLPPSAVPFKVLRNEGNFRQHDAYKVGFRPNVVGSAIDDYVADPLCVDLTVTPEDFTVDDVQIRELTLLGGNCRLEVFNA